MQLAPHLAIRRNNQEPVTGRYTPLPKSGLDTD
jgi:hypothetical protein